MLSFLLKISLGQDVGPVRYSVPPDAELQMTYRNWPGPKPIQISFLGRHMPTSAVYTGLQQSADTSRLHAILVLKDDKILAIFSEKKNLAKKREKKKDGTTNIVP